ncbi:hypothetical protein WN55_06368 [Dufourea novaeangliae]|uniref:Uncharacterized protein n=1 Tax=Dufourea novaeangliae TaxID=178035 RepID=A0A154PQE5_DUFNO|nr:hypothetical protein WN55_06368 [Dufourea novaeangliae]
MGDYQWGPARTIPPTPTAPAVMLPDGPAIRAGAATGPARAAGPAAGPANTAPKNGSFVIISSRFLRGRIMKYFQNTIASA